MPIAPQQNLSARKTVLPLGERGAETLSGGLEAEAVKALKARDNVTNWYFLAQTYGVILTTISLAIWGSAELNARGVGFAWIALLDIAAIVVVGAAQHQLGGAIHEGTHFLLFKNRTLNEIASDWLAAFPIYTSTYQFRIHHLAHHQFVNDPARDPDIAQLKESGHWLDFPVPPLELLWAFVKRLSPVGLMRFTVIRAKYSAVGFDRHAYIDPDRRSSPWPLRAGIIFAVPIAIVAATLINNGQALAGVALFAVSFIVTLGYLLSLKEEDFAATRIAPVISHKTTMLSRIVYFGLLYGTLTAIQLSLVVPAWHYFLLYWVIPLFTSFPVFMMLRQWVQHGNADRGRFTNTRVFLVGPLIRYAIFPWGMDYHLPHHLMASVPHYKLKTLHQLLLENGEYRDKGVILDGFFKGGNGPSVVEALGPDQAPKVSERAFVDSASLEYAEVLDPEAIAREAGRSARGA